MCTEKLLLYSIKNQKKQMFSSFHKWQRKKDKCEKPIKMIMHPNNSSHTSPKSPTGHASVAAPISSLRNVNPK